MKAIIKIGTVQIMLPSMTGVEAVMKTLGKGVQVHYYAYDKKIVHQGPIELSLDMVPDGIPVVAEGSEDDPMTEYYEKAKAKKTNGAPLALPEPKVLRLGN